MPISFGKTTARLEGACTAEEVLQLLDWLQSRSRARINMSRCTHLHTAVLQALRAARVEVRQPPADPFLNRHVLPFLHEARGMAGDRNKE